MSLNLSKPAPIEGVASDVELLDTDIDVSASEDVTAGSAAPEDVVTAANGWPLAEDGGEPFVACRAYLRAIHAGDWTALHLLVAGEAAALFDETCDFRVIQGLRPAAPSPAGGFRNERLATVTVQGVTRGGFVATWTYQLALLEGGWKVERERWD